MDYYYRQPRYYSSFRCIGGDCPETCCYEWNIDWSESEIEKLRSAEMSDDLKKSIKNVFIFNEERKAWIIKLDETGRCPLQNKETGLCEIQKQLGEDYLSDTCRNYPRVFFFKENYIFRMIDCSCLALLEIIVNDKNAVILENIPARDPEKQMGSSIIKYEKEDFIVKSPFLKKRLQITDFFLEILHGNRSLEASMILAAMAAKKISDAAENNNIKEIDNTIQIFRKQAAQSSAARAAEGIEPNLKLKFVIVNNLMVSYFGADEAGISISVLHDGERVIPENYERGKKEFDKAFEGREWAMRNIAENMFLDVFYHLNLTQGTFFEMFAYYTACVAAIQVFAYAIGFASKNIEKDFIRAIAHLSRRLSHNRYVADKVVNEMKALGLTSPAHLALIIK